MLLSIKDAQAFLAVSERTVYRLIEDGKIRRGYVRSKPVTCRSVRQYLATVEA